MVNGALISVTLYILQTGKEMKGERLICVRLHLYNFNKGGGSPIAFRILPIILLLNCLSNILKYNSFITYTFVEK